MGSASIALNFFDVLSAPILAGRIRLAVLSGLALLLSLTAIYSVMAFNVTPRTREMGIRQPRR
jgi:hypothetical protein